MTSAEQIRRRRPWVYAVSAIVLGILGMGLVAALIISAEAASRSADTAAATAKDFREYRTDSEDRSAKAVADRARLAEQNLQLEREIKALTKYLKDNGIDVPTVAAPDVPSATAKSPSATSSGKKPSKPHPKSPTTSAPATSSPVTPNAPSAAAPATSPTPLVCVLGICL